MLGADGRDDAAALDAKADAPATVIRAALADRNGSLLAHELGSRGLDPADATRDPALRRVVAPGLGADVPCRARRDGRRRGPGRAHRRRRAAAVRAPRRGAARDAARLRAAGAPAAARRAAARLPRRRRDRARVRGARRRVHPGDRRRGEAVLRLPRVPPRQARVRGRARARRDDDALAHGPGVPAARPAGEVLRRRPGPAHRGRPRHGRPPRHVRPRLHGQVLRGQGLPRPRQLQRELQRRR